MGSISRPTKEQVREWLAERRLAAQPLPNCEQIRRKLGWAYRSAELPPALRIAQPHERTI